MLLHSGSQQPFQTLPCRWDPRHGTPGLAEAHDRGPRSTQSHALGTMSWLQYVAMKGTKMYNEKRPAFQNPQMNRGGSEKKIQYSFSCHIQCCPMATCLLPNLPNTKAHPGPRDSVTESKSRAVNMPHSKMNTYGADTLQAYLHICLRKPS